VSIFAEVELFDLLVTGPDDDASQRSLHGHSPGIFIIVSGQEVDRSMQATSIFPVESSRSLKSAEILQEGRFIEAGDDDAIRLGNNAASGEREITENDSGSHVFA